MISAEIVAAEKTRQFLERPSKIGVEPSGMTSQEMAEEIAAHMQRWRAVAKDVAPKGSKRADGQTSIRRIIRPPPLNCLATIAQFLASPARPTE